MIKVKVTCL